MVALVIGFVNNIRRGSSNCLGTFTGAGVRKHKKIKDSGWDELEKNVDEFA
jgi:hypothetical protein